MIFKLDTNRCLPHCMSLHPAMPNDTTLSVEALSLLCEALRRQVWLPELPVCLPVLRRPGVPKDFRMPSLVVYILQVSA